MATITHLGLVVLTVGAISFATDRDVIVEADAGTLLGPLMVVTSMAAVFFTLVRSFGVADRERATPRILVPALVAAAASYVGMLVVGGFLYALARGEMVWWVLFAGRYAGSSFVVVSSLWVAVAVGGGLLSARYDGASGARPGEHDEL